MAPNINGKEIITDYGSAVIVEYDQSRKSFLLSTLVKTQLDGFQKSIFTEIGKWETRGSNEHIHVHR